LLRGQPADTNTTRGECHNDDRERPEGAAHELLLLFDSLRIGIGAARPIIEQRSKTTNDVRPLGRTLVTLADVVAEVEQQQVVCVNHELPIALTDGLLRTVGIGRRPPEERPLLLWRAPFENREDVDPS
jgi:hypothetical protein